MKMQAYVEFKFTMCIELETVQALRIVASYHYDHVCREAGQDTGFMGYWESSLQRDKDKPYIPHGQTEPQTPYVYTTWREMDLCLKIHEQALFQCKIKHITKEQLAKLDSMFISFRKVFDKAHELYEPFIDNFNKVCEYSGDWNDE